jgi:hypothetical protein
MEKGRRPERQHQPRIVVHDDAAAGMKRPTGENSPGRPRYRSRDQCHGPSFRGRLPSVRYQGRPCAAQGFTSQGRRYPGPPAAETDRNTPKQKKRDGPAFSVGRVDASGPDARTVPQRPRETGRKTKGKGTSRVIRERTHIQDVSHVARDVGEIRHKRHRDLGPPKQVLERRPGRQLRRKRVWQSAAGENRTRAQQTQPNGRMEVVLSAAPGNSSLHSRLWLTFSLFPPAGGCVLF